MKHYTKELIRQWSAVIGASLTPGAIVAGLAAAEGAPILGLVAGLVISTPILSFVTAPEVLHGEYDGDRTFFGKRLDNAREKDRPVKEDQPARRIYQSNSLERALAGALLAQTAEQRSGGVVTSGAHMEGHAPQTQCEYEPKEPR